MRKRLFLGGVAVAIALLVAVAGACGPDLQPKVDELQSQVDQLQAQVQELQGTNDALMAFAGPLPASLDNLYPPKAEAPVWLLEMFALEGPFGGIGNDLQQGDIEGAMANYEAFKAQYEKLAGMVPEWQSLFPMEPVTALGTALKSGDPSKVGPAMGQVGAVCGACHTQNMVKAQQRYHWPDFHDVKITDPLSHEEMAWGDYMTALGGAFGGVGNDLQQGQLDNARANFQAFKARFETLAKEGCSNVRCHGDSPRAYFVDASVLGMIDQLGKELGATQPNAEAIAQLSGGIGNESCMKCHLVHVPSVLGNERLELFETLFK